MPDIKRPAPMEPMAEPLMAQPPRKSKSGWGARLLVIVIIVVVILVGLFLVSKYTSWNILQVDKGPSSAGWQAVFLSNGQVYFGKVASKSGDILTLREVYYLQVSEPIQPTPEGSQPQQNLSLVKLGNELHGPKDEMRINRDHILFTEDLKSDSRVVDAIVKYLEDLGN